LCQDIDEKDTVYIAVALEFDVILITSDKTLFTGLKKQNFTQVMLFKDVIDTLPSIQEEKLL
jgi:predicted nucleic acid-binding protein